MIKLELSEREYNIIIAMCDVVLKATGLQGMDDVRRILELLQAAKAAVPVPEVE